ncbi:MAG: DUF6483 family protein [Clostridium sp.]|uniref:DUF6483 family protein n=1 Tax=Clostridium sp. TaxID=1506 RepID=UPI0039EC7E04
MNESDYIMKLIKSSTQLLVTIFSGKNAMDSLVNEQNGNVTISENDLLSIMLNNYINAGKINEAENMIFEHIEICKSPFNLQIALSFYKKLNLWSDDKLAKCNFSRNEIVEGLRDVKKYMNKISLVKVKCL